MTQRHTLAIENLKCGGCAKTISSRLGLLEGVTDVTIDTDAEEVSFVACSDCVNSIRDTLPWLGYPEPGVPSTLSGVGAKVRAPVSCVRGKVGAA
mgnify:CR=1 FL=1